MGEHDRKPTVYYVNLSQDWSNDPHMTAWAREFLDKFLASEELSFDTFVPSLGIAELERLDAQVQGDDHPAALEMIMNAVKRVRGE